ncbi:hypothetical protein NDU88_007908 [Pleurodeles waltl]|uniref:Uncharacterized protein n=1 Tax=Pleurodeles waltl TaxID=8319 RepID=A0AAV7STU3_PLEWA|nr:hypothetical protein NDU88_007908 [Pleurodeles waltl]
MRTDRSYGGPGRSQSGAEWLPGSEEGEERRRHNGGALIVVLALPGAGHGCDSSSPGGEDDDSGTEIHTGCVGDGQQQAPALGIQRIGAPAQWYQSGQTPVRPPQEELTRRLGTTGQAAEGR